MHLFCYPLSLRVRTGVVANARLLMRLTTSLHVAIIPRTVRLAEVFGVRHVGSKIGIVEGEGIEGGDPGRENPGGDIYAPRPWCCCQEKKNCGSETMTTH